MYILLLNNIRTVWYCMQGMLYGTQKLKTFLKELTGTCKCTKSKNFFLFFFKLRPVLHVARDHLFYYVIFVCNGVYMLFFV